MVLVGPPAPLLKAPWRRRYRRRTRYDQKAPPPLPRVKFVQREVLVYPTTQSARVVPPNRTTHAPTRPLPT